MLNFAKSVSPMKKQTHLHLGWPEGLQVYFNFGGKYSFNTVCFALRKVFYYARFYATFLFIHNVAKRSRLHIVNCLSWLHLHILVVFS